MSRSILPGYAYTLWGFIVREFIWDIPSLTFAYFFGVPKLDSDRPGCYLRAFESFVLFLYNRGGLGLGSNV